ncbi:MAG: DNA repair protein RecO, partial [Oscillospiraceae bacterium]
FLPAPVLYALRHICYSDAKKIFSFDIAAESLKTLSLFTEQYLIFQLGRSFRTLDFFKSL